MKEIIAKRIAALLEVKSLVTLALTAAMVVMLFRADSIPNELLALFSTAYGSVITYFFTRKSGAGGEDGKS